MSNIVVGQPLPEINIVKGGVGTPEGKFIPWGSSELVGKPTYLVANAGYPEANEMHVNATEKVAAEKQIRMCRIMNVKDSPMGASMFIKKEFKKGAKEDPTNLFVMDSKGLIGDQFAMQKKSAVTVVLDANGIVVFAYEGEHNAEVEAQVSEAVASVI
jgi:predicted transcriptional regulator